MRNGSSRRRPKSLERLKRRDFRLTAEYYAEMEYTDRRVICLQAD